MTWTKMGTVPNPVSDGNGDPYSGAVLKCYDPGTTDAISIAIDSSGSSPQASFTANAGGKWEVSGNEEIPYIDRECKWGIFANATDAAANTPFYMGPFDNVPQSLSGVNSLNAIRVNTSNLGFGDSNTLNPDNISGSCNLALGDGSLAAATTAIKSIGIGVNSLAALTTGQNNIAIGDGSMCAVAVNCINLAIGTDALKTLADASGTSARFNIALGHEAMLSSTSARCSVAIGYCALYDNTTGVNNVAVGVGSLQNNLTGDCNVALGRDTLLINTTGCCNTAIGEESLQQVTTGSQNSALGMEAGRCITTGTYNIALGASSMLGTAITGSFNIAAGCLALNSLTSGNHNIGIGRQATSGIMNGTNNIGIGCLTAIGITSGRDNIVIGRNGACVLASGDCNIYIGANTSSCGIATETNNVYIGHGLGQSYSFGENNIIAIHSGDVSHPLIWGSTGGTKRLVIPHELGWSSDQETLGYGRFGFKTTEETHTLTLGATSDTTSISVPVGARLEAVSLTVDTAVTNDGDNTWSAAFITGSTTAIAAAGTSAAQNTKVNTALVPEIVASGAAEIRFTPQSGSFTAGVIQAVVYYSELTDLANQGV